MSQLSSIRQAVLRRDFEAAAEALSCLPTTAEEESPESLLLRGELALKTNDLMGSYRCFKQAASRFNDPRAYYGSGLVCELQGKPRAAERLYAEARDKDKTLGYLPSLETSAWEDLAHNPSDPWPMSMLARYQLTIPGGGTRLAEARRSLEEARRLCRCEKVSALTALTARNVECIEARLASCLEVWSDGLGENAPNVTIGAKVDTKRKKKDERGPSKDDSNLKLYLRYKIDGGDERLSPEAQASLCSECERLINPVWVSGCVFGSAESLLFGGMEVNLILTCHGAPLSLGTMESKARQLIGTDVVLKGGEEGATAVVTALMYASFDAPDWKSELLSPLGLHKPEASPLQVLALSPAELDLAPDALSGTTATLSLALEGWEDLVGVLPNLGLAVLPPWETGNKCNMRTGHWDATFFLEHGATGSLEPNSNCGRVAEWDPGSKELRDSKNKLSK